MKPCNTNRLKARAALLPMLVAMVMQAHALESLSDDSLGKVSGKDGIAITASMDSATIGKATWQDGEQGSLVFENISITHPDSTAASTVPVSNTVTVQTGSDGTNAAGIGLGLQMGKATIDIPTLSICDKDGANCAKLGALAVTNAGTETQLSLVTSNGLFNEAGNAQLKAVLDNFSVALKQTNGGTTNQLILGDMYANMTADGKLFVESDRGLRFIGKVSFDEKTLSGSLRQGLEVLVQHSSDDGATQKVFGKVALTGTLNDVDVMLRGVSGTTADLGFDNGTGGIHTRISANIDENLKLQLGGGDGTGTPDGMRLTGWHTFGSIKSFDSGDVYVNIIPSSASTAQSLTTSPRLVKDPSLLAAAESQASYLSANFVKPEGDTNETPFGTSQTFVSKDGYVVDSQNNTVKVFDALVEDAANGQVVNASGQHISVKDVLKDGYVVNGTIDQYAGGGSLINQSYGGDFEQVEQVNADGTTSLFIRDVYDTNSGTSSIRNSRQVYVWRSMVNRNNNPVSFPTGVSNNVVVASFENNGNGNDEWFKAVNVVSGNRLSDNNLTNINRPYTVNSQGEVRDRDGRILLTRHEFNELGFLQESATGEYVYEYDYAINANNQLVITKKQDGTEVNRIQLLTFDPSSVQLLTQDAYTQNADLAEQGATAAQSISVNVRGMSMQAMPTKTEFFQGAPGSEELSVQNFGVAPVIYHADANVLLFPKTMVADNGDATRAANETTAGFTKAGEAIGYKLNMSTKGSDGDASFTQAGAKQTTGLLVAHTADDGKKRYLGLRHMDSVVKTHGELQITSEGLAVTAKDLLFAFRGEVATGELPDAGNAFNSNYDRLLVAEGRIKGELFAKIVSDNSLVGFAGFEGLGFEADLKLKQGTYGTNSGVRLITADGNGSLGLSEITGALNVKGVVDTVAVNDGQTGFKGGVNAKVNLTLNPDNDAMQDIRIKNIGFSASPIQAGSGHFDSLQEVRIGELALTKHNIYQDITIRGAD